MAHDALRLNIAGTGRECLSRVQKLARFVGVDVDIVPSPEFNDPECFLERFRWKHGLVSRLASQSGLRTTRDEFGKIVFLACFLGRFIRCGLR